MKTKLLVGLGLSLALATGGLRAQTALTPTSAPAVAAPSPAQTPNQTVYGQRLPSVAELSNVASAQGLTVERIEQTPTQVTAVYKNANGQTNAVAYLLLPTAAGAPAAAPTAAPTTPAPRVVYYEPAPRVVYYDDYAPTYYSYPRYWYPPVSIGLGFGFRSGGFRSGGVHGGSFHGGFHHGR